MGWHFIAVRICDSINQGGHVALGKKKQKYEKDFGRDIFSKADTLKTEKDIGGQYYNESKKVSCEDVKWTQDQIQYFS